MFEKDRIKISQEIGLKLLEVFDSMCKKHNLTYFLDAGTLLGAVRNGKFIAWDDDVDVMMPRQDYEKLKHLVSGFSDDVFFQNHDTDPHYTWYLPRLLWKESNVYYHKTALHAKALNKVSLDIFVIDSAPNNKAIFKVWLLLVKFLVGMSKRNVKLKYYKPSERILLGLTSVFSKIIPKKTQQKLYYWLATRYHNKTRYSAILNHSFPRMGDYMDADIFNNTIFLDFENSKYPVPERYHEYLTMHFGNNYIELPPIGKRNPHPVDKFDASI